MDDKCNFMFIYEEWLVGQAHEWSFHQDQHQQQNQEDGVRAEG